MYFDAEDTWGEDCPRYVDHPITCPDCSGRGFIPTKVVKP